MNQINLKVNLEEDYHREKMVNQQINVDYSPDSFLEHYIYQLCTEIKHLENEINDWKIRYITETQYKNDAYHLLSGGYHN